MINEESYLQLLNSNMLVEFKKRQKKTPINHNSRKDRNRVVANIINDSPNKNILNIGSGGEYNLKKQLSKHRSCFDIDISGDCDLILDLDEIEKLPFDDCSFDMSCALDVLEHLEQFHLIFYELFRISKKNVLISLPNSAYEIFHNVLKNKPQKRPDLNRGIFSKYYGLPIVIPNDRHRWWLYFQDIIRFFVWFEINNDCVIEFYTPKPKKAGRLIKLFHPHLYYSFFCPYIFVNIIKNK
jgi:hypothetical protein